MTGGYCVGVSTRWLRSPSSALAGALCALLTACTADHHPAQRGAADGSTGVGTAPARANDGAVGPSENGRSEAFQVQLSTDISGSHICRGACARLSARAEEGVPPYRYAFDQGSSEDVSTQQVCPTQTTTYRVIASDSSFEGEFGGKNAPVSASLTLVVEPCFDGALPPLADAGLSDASLATPTKPSMRDSGVGPSGTVACEKAIATSSSAGWFEAGNYTFAHSLVTDGDGDALFVARYNGTITLSDGTQHSTKAPDASAVLVGKLAPDCRLLWAKSLSGWGSAAAARITTDSHGRVIVMNATQRLDHREIWNLSLSVLTPGGELVWEKVLGALEGSIGAVHGDANDDIVMVIGALAGADFGGGPLGKPALPPHHAAVVLAKYSAAGIHLWSKQVQEEAALPALAISDGTTILLHARSSKALDWGTAGRTSGTQPSGAHGYLVAADAAGNYLWSRVVSDAGDPSSPQDQLEVSASGQLVWSQVANAGELTVASVDGTSVSWNKQVLSPHIPNANIWYKTRGDAFGNTFVGGSFYGDVNVNGVSLRGTNSLAYVQKLAPDGSLRWTYLPSTSDPSAPTELLDVSSDGQGGALMLTTPLDHYQHELDVLRLFP